MSACGGSALGGKKYYLSLLFISSFLIIAPAFAADYYVDGDNGDDVIGDGSQEAPYQTITKAVAVMAGGDTVYCRGTIIDGDISLTNAIAGTASGYTTFTSLPGYTAIIDASSGPYNSVFTINNGADYLRIEDLKLTGASLYAIYGSVGGTSQYVEILNNEIYNILPSAFSSYLLLGNINYLTISGNEIYGDGDDYYGLYIASLDSAVIEKNKLHDFTRWAIATEGTVSNTKIKNNFIYNITGDAAYPTNGAIVITEGNNYEIDNNTIYNANSPALSVYGIVVVPSGGAINNISVHNNIFHTTNIAMAVHDDARVGFSSDYNDFYNVVTIGIWDNVNRTTLEEWQTASNSDKHSITTDSLFSSTTSGSEDLHLQDSSPCIDAGQNISEITEDFDSETRPYNITDIGADERPLLSAVPIITAIDNDADSVSMSVSYDTDIIGYNVMLDANSSFYSSSPIEISDLDPAQTYDYSVQAVYETDYDAYYSSYSSIANFTTYPSKVLNVKMPMKKIKKTRATIKWDKQPRINGYIIRLLNYRGKHLKTININKNKAKKIITNLKSLKNYSLKIRARKKVNNTYLLGEWSSVKEFTTR